MVKLSQLTPKVDPETKRSIRATIPVFFNDGEKLVSEKVTIYNLDIDTVQKIVDELDGEEEKDENDEKKQAKIFLTLIKYATDIIVDDDNLENFANFLKIFNETNKAIQMELSEMWTEINIVGLDAMKKFMELPDDKKAKHVLLNPEMAKVFDQLKGITEHMAEEEPSKPSEEELKKIEEAKALMEKYNLYIKE